MATICRDDYLTTKVNLLPFVTDGQLLEMTVTTDVLIREMSAIVADHPPAKLGMSPQRTSEARLGLTEEQTEEAIKAIEQDDVATLKRIIEDKIKENPKLKEIFLSSAKSGRVGQVKFVSYDNVL